MSIRYRIHRILQLVQTVIGKETNPAELGAYSRQLKADPDFDSAFDQVIEFASGNGSTDAAVPLQVLSCLVPPVNRVQMAIVAPQDKAFQIARDFKLIYAFPDEVLSVFRSAEDAFSWFGLEGKQSEWGGWKSVQQDSSRNIQ